MLSDHPQAIITIAGLADYLNSFLFDQGSQPLDKDAMVVGEHDSRRHDSDHLLNGALQSSGQIEELRPEAGL
jgi:hypothetical protein